VGSRFSELKEKLDAGTATDDDKKAYRDERAKRDKKSSYQSGSSEPPPRDSETPGKDSTSTDKKWRDKYGAVDGREQICVTLASYLDGMSVALANYIKANDGSPVVPIADDFQKERDADGKRVKTERCIAAQAQWANLLVLAVDDMLPPNVVATPAIIAAGGGGALLLQSAIVARRKQVAREPQKPQYKTAESEVERARKAKDANVEDKETKESEKAPEPEPVKKMSTEREIKRDKEGNRIV
jgi:hypothetical protein